MSSESEHGSQQSPDEQDPPDREPSLSLVAQRMSTAVGGTERIRSFASLGLLLLGVLALLRLARTFFIPLAFAILLFFLLRPVVRGFAKLRIPRPFSAALLVGTILGLLVAGGTALYQPAAGWMQRVPHGLQQIEHKIGPLRGSMQDVTQVAEQVEEITRVDPRRVREVTIREQPLSEVIVTRALVWSMTTLVTLIVLYLMLLSGERFMRRLLRYTLGLHDEERAASAFSRVEQQMSAYLFTIVAINALLGIAIAAAMKLLEMPNAPLWGVLAFTLNFVPYLGAIVGASIVSLVALMSLEATAQAFAVGGAYLLLSALEGSLITPLILGRRLRLNPLVIFVWLAFWGWLWGIPGAILAVPLLTFVKLICEQTEALAPVADLLER